MLLTAFDTRLQIAIKDFESKLEQTQKTCNSHQCESNDFMDQMQAHIKDSFTP